MGATILVVEDDADAAESVRDVLVGAGYQVPELAASCEDALQAASRISPSLVLMDIQLSGPIDGIETVRRLREARRIPVVYLTGAADDETLRRAKDTAPLGYLRKPINPRALRIAVEIALHQGALEAALEARERWFSTTLRSIADAVVTTDRDARVTFVNTAAVRLLGDDTRGAEGQPIDQVVRLGGHSLTALVRRALEERNPIPLPFDARLASALEIEGSVAPMGDETDAPGVVLVFRDVAPQRRLARRLEMTERLAAIGTMAAGMQHEINNPLAAVVANLQYALDVARSARPIDADLVAALEDASAGAERVRRTVADLRHVGGEDEAEKTTLDLAEVVDEAAKRTEHTARHHAAIRVEHAPAPPVSADRSQLVRVFMNLLLEAAQATGDGHAEQNVIVVSTQADEAGRATAEVHTDAAVVAAEVIHRAFEPFATGRPTATAGLRLAICHSIVTSVGGEIEAFARDDGGTTFRVTLPPARPRPAARMSTRPPNGKRARILVVDDELAIGKAIRRILAREHDVEVETNARTACDRLEHDTFDVVFCDLMMPDMSGMDLFDAVTSRSPADGERFVFLTGGAFSPRSEEFLRATKNVCLAKPFTRDTVVAIVRNMAR